MVSFLWPYYLQKEFLEHFAVSQIYESKFFKMYNGLVNPAQTPTSRSINFSRFGIFKKFGHHVRQCESDWEPSTFKAPVVQNLKKMEIKIQKEEKRSMKLCITADGKSE